MKNQDKGYKIKITILAILAIILRFEFYWVGYSLMDLYVNEKYISSIYELPQQKSSVPLSMSISKPVLPVIIQAGETTFKTIGNLGRSTRDRLISFFEKETGQKVTLQPAGKKEAEALKNLKVEDSQLTPFTDKSGKKIEAMIADGSLSKEITDSDKFLSKLSGTDVEKYKDIARGALPEVTQITRESEVLNGSLARIYMADAIEINKLDLVTGELTKIELTDGLKKALDEGIHPIGNVNFTNLSREEQTRLLLEGKISFDRFPEGTKDMFRPDRSDFIRFNESSPMSSTWQPREVYEVTLANGQKVYVEGLTDTVSNRSLYVPITEGLEGNKFLKINSNFKADVEALKAMGSTEDEIFQATKERFEDYIKANGSDYLQMRIDQLLEKDQSLRAQGRVGLSDELRDWMKKIRNDTDLFPEKIVSPDKITLPSMEQVAAIAAMAGMEENDTESAQKEVAQTPPGGDDSFPGMDLANKTLDTFGVYGPLAMVPTLGIAAASSFVALTAVPVAIAAGGLAIADLGWKIYNDNSLAKQLPGFLLDTFGFGPKDNRDKIEEISKERFSQSPKPATTSKVENDVPGSVFDGQITGQEGSNKTTGGGDSKSPSFWEQSGNGRDPTQAGEELSNNAAKQGQDVTPGAVTGSADVSQETLAGDPTKNGSDYSNGNQPQEAIPPIQQTPEAPPQPEKPTDVSNVVPETPTGEPPSWSFDVPAPSEITPSMPTPVPETGPLRPDESVIPVKLEELLPSETKEEPPAETPPPQAELETSSKSFFDTMTEGLPTGTGQIGVLEKVPQVAEALYNKVKDFFTPTESPKQVPDQQTQQAIQDGQKADIAAREQLTKEVGEAYDRIATDQTTQQATEEGQKATVSAIDQLISEVGKIYESLGLTNQTEEISKNEQDQQTDNRELIQSLLDQVNKLIDNLANDIANDILGNNPDNLGNDTDGSATNNKFEQPGEGNTANTENLGDERNQQKEEAIFSDSNDSNAAMNLFADPQEGANNDSGSGEENSGKPGYINPGFQNSRESFKNAPSQLESGSSSQQYGNLPSNAGEQAPQSPGENSKGPVLNPGGGDINGWGKNSSGSDQETAPPNPSESEARPGTGDKASNSDEFIPGWGWYGADDKPSGSNDKAGGESEGNPESGGPEGDSGNGGNAGGGE